MDEPLDKLDDMASVLLALAVYDWFRFNDIRIFRLKNEYGINLSNQKVLEYYYTSHPEYLELNHNRYVKRYKQYLSALVYA